MKRLRPGAIAMVLVTGLAGATVRAESLRADVDARRVGVDDEVELTLTVEGKLLDDVPLPPLTNLKVVGGPSVSTQVCSVNGQTSQSRTWTWVLRPAAAGKAEVGPARARFSGGEQTAPAIPIDVVAGSVKPQHPSRRPDPCGDLFGGIDPFESMRGRPRERAATPQIALEAVPNRTSVHVGEPLLLTYYLYTQTTVTDLQFTDAPKYAGFWVEDLERPQASSGEAATLGGVSYRRFAIILKLLYPTRAGTLSLPASTMRIAIPAQGFFDSGAVVERSTKPMTIEVKPIPDEPGFSGAVGRFRASASLDRDTVALGEAATLRFKVEGGGNLKWIDRGPEVVLEGARVYPPQTKSDLKAGPGGLTGSKTWEFVVVPQTTGTLEVPALGFSFYDPAEGRVAKTETRALPLRVEGGTAAAGVSAPVLPRAATAAAPLPLRSDLDLPRAALPALSGRAMVLAAGAVLLLHGLLYGGSVVARRRGGVSAHRAGSRSVAAALRELERVGKDAMSKEEAAALIEKTLHDRFGSRDGDEGERARAVARVLEEVHFVRYAPQLGDYSEKLRDLAGRAAELVKRWA